MAEVYTDFAEVYDELMDNVPYETWCENIVSLIETYGISVPVERADCQTVDQRAQELASGDIDSEALAPEREPVPDGADSEALAPERELAHDDAEPELLASERNLVLDLGCGTGTLTELLYRRGYDMIGVDNSPRMLEIAMEKRAESGSEILYLLQDMRELELYSTVGTVISVCDSLNYLLEEEEMLAVFRLVNNYLYPGGLFLFDFNTVYKYGQIIGDATIAENREDCSFIWENYYHEVEEINEYDLTVFVREEGERFRRFAENHFQRGYRPETMRRLVEQAGMKLLRMLDADTMGEVTAQSERIYMLAREQGKLGG
ncbi:MAG: class I SAM-dependent methyltransferase [bacterium]|nr:class I SAM-dependent methyltransferase [bacterium]MCM1373871.1 class I SAM-dependent methyltransferase [Muribaculum sp.]